MLIAGIELYSTLMHFEANRVTTEGILRDYHQLLLKDFNFAVKSVKISLEILLTLVDKLLQKSKCHFSNSNL